MILLLFFLQLTFFFFLSNVAALNITVQTDTIVGQPSLVLWAREPNDGNGLLVFDLRFVKPPPDNEDVGLALANVLAPPSTEFGTVQVVYQKPGSYLLVAVSGLDYTWIGQTGQVNAFQVPFQAPATSIPMSTSQPVPSATTSAKPTSTSATSSAKPTSTSRSTALHKKNVGAIIGGTLGGVAFLALLAVLGIVFLRRRQPKVEDNRRWTFNRDNMVLPPVLDIRRSSRMKTELFSPDDIEQQGLSPHNMMAQASPSGSPRPFHKSPLRPLPLPSSPISVVVPLNPHQEEMVAQIEQIRNQMSELEKTNPGPAQHIILGDLQRQMNWLKSQF